jgi:predicted DNA binding CopG/RHH family protein
MEVRLPRDQLEALKKAAKQQGIPYTRLVRRFIDEGMRAMDRPSGQ